MFISCLPLWDFLLQSCLLSVREERLHYTNNSQNETSDLFCYLWLPSVSLIYLSGSRPEYKHTSLTDKIQILVYPWRKKKNKKEKKEEKDLRGIDDEIKYLTCFNFFLLRLMFKDKNKLS